MCLEEQRLLDDEQHASGLEQGTQPGEAGGDPLHVVQHAGGDDDVIGVRRESLAHDLLVQIEEAAREEGGVLELLSSVLKEIARDVRKAEAGGVLRQRLHHRRRRPAVPAADFQNVQRMILRHDGDGVTDDLVGVVEDRAVKPLDLAGGVDLGGVLALQQQIDHAFRLGGEEAEALPGETRLYLACLRERERLHEAERLPVAGEEPGFFKAEQRPFQPAFVPGADAGDAQDFVGGMAFPFPPVYAELVQRSLDAGFVKLTTQPDILFKPLKARVLGDARNAGVHRSHPLPQAVGIPPFDGLAGMQAVVALGREIGGKAGVLLVPKRLDDGFADVGMLEHGVLDLTEFHAEPVDLASRSSSRPSNTM